MSRRAAAGTIGPADIDAKSRLFSRARSAVRGRFYRALTRRSLKTTGHFAGFQLTGRFRAAHLVALIRALPDGFTEFMCHPGCCTDELRAARTRLKESREQELATLLDPTVRAALDQSGVQLCAY